MSDYQAFLETKALSDPRTGFEPSDLSDGLKDFQEAVVTWAVRRGRAAIFEDTGLGKTFQQLEWARQVNTHTGGRVLIVTPLCVAPQTVLEGQKFGIDTKYAREMEDASDGITVTNYEMIDHFDLSEFSGVVLDESSILKHQQGKTRTKLIRACQTVPYRLSCTATPAPNDHMELGNQAEFLGVMSAVEMLAMFFTHDGGDTSKWRLKGHGKTRFWEWLATWAVVIKHPSDIGFSDDGYDLPPLRMHEHVVTVDHAPRDGFLFPVEASGLMERNQARRLSVDDRVAKAAEIANGTDKQMIVWCHRNDESEKLTAAIDGAISVSGSDSIDAKESRIAAFSSGEARVLVTKPSIAGFGMNWQHCNKMVFVGLSDSWESYYQAIRRCWRFGQTKPVDVHVVSAETEGAVVANIKRKEAQAAEMSEQMVKHMQAAMNKEIFGMEREKTEYQTDVASGDGWEVHLGDCVDVVGGIKSDTVGYTVFSPPFASLYTYSNSDRDMGNCADDDTFMDHFRFLVDELFRVTMPGRLLSFHCMNLPTSKAHHGFIGIRDFRGELIRMFTDAGWIFHSEVCIWKDPVTAMQRTKALGLLHKQLKKDSCMSRQGIPDYLVTMRKPGENIDPVTNTNETFPVSEWQHYASPVWMDINPSRTLNKDGARESDDERHICPLQLDVIERALRLWSKPGDLVLSPFTGIGSEGYCAVKDGRRFIGAELKRSYWQQAIKNLEIATREQIGLFSE